MQRLIRLMLCLMIVLFVLPISIANAITLPSSFVETNVASGLGMVTAMEFAPDGRLFATIQTGAVRVIKDGVLLPTPFITLSVDSFGERGVLGLTFDPNFASNHFVYIYYTVPTAPIHNRLSRFTANGDVAVSGSEVQLLNLETLSASNHNGGAIHFGPDGKLYVAVGENAVGSNAQTLNNRLGKILRINADGTIPTDNPFYATATGDNRSIWALGLRNPFTFAFQRGTTRMFINDVGESAWEEINDGIVGSNYGWNTTEGYTSNVNFRSPLFAYPHSGGSQTGCAISGGAFYNPVTPQFPPTYVGKYFFADYCSAWIYYVDPSGTAPLTATQFALSTTGNPVDLKVGPDGSLYYAARGGGGVINKISTSGPIESVGVFRPSNGLIYLRNSLTTGFADFTMVLGVPGDVGLAGDWDNDGIDSPGVYRPSARQFFLSNRICNCTVFADYSIAFGIAGDTPFVGDWNGDRRTGVGVYRSSDNTLYLRNDPTSSGIADISAVFGAGSDKPLAGHWPNSMAVLSQSKAAPPFLP